MSAPVQPAPIATARKKRNRCLNRREILTTHVKIVRSRNYCPTKNKHPVLDSLRKSENYRRCSRSTSERRRRRHNHFPRPAAREVERRASRTSPSAADRHEGTGCGLRRPRYRTCLMRGSRVLSMERVLMCERSTSGRPAAAMAGAGATARVRAHLLAPRHWPAPSRGAARPPHRTRRHPLAIHRTVNTHCANDGL